MRPETVGLATVCPEREGGEAFTLANTGVSYSVMVWGEM